MQRRCVRDTANEVSKYFNSRVPGGAKMGGTGLTYSLIKKNAKK